MKPMMLFLSVSLPLVILFVAPKFAIADDNDDGRKVGVFLGANMRLELLKISECQNFVKTYNPTFYEKKHMKEAVEYLKVRYPKLQPQLQQKQLKEFHESIGPAIAESVLKDIGKNPSATSCGVVTGSYEKMLEKAKSSLPR